MKETQVTRYTNLVPTRSIPQAANDVNSPVPALVPIYYYYYFFFICSYGHSQTVAILISSQNVEQKACDSGLENS